MTIPETLKHYRILAPVGKGGMGEVYAAEDQRLHRKVAIKVLPPVLAHDPERRQRFEREAQVVAALNHPNIVTIHSVEEDGGVPFLTMELVEGRPLHEIVAGGPLPLDQLLRVGIAVSDAMAAAHQRGIVHRDLKPGNIMLTADGRVKVLDFGLAKLREAQAEAAADEVTRMPSHDLTGEGRIIGTVAYMSPEQAEGKSVDARSDIFSFGVVLHELATGERPFKGDTTVSLISSILKDTPAAVTDLNPSLPGGLARVIRRSLAKDPSRRYQTAIDLRNELEELKLETESGLTSSVSPARRPTAPGRRPVLNAVAIAASVVMLLAAVGLAYSYWTRRGAGGSEFLEIDRPARLTTTASAALAAISPDGRYVAHVKNDPGGPSLWMRQTATTSDVQIVAPASVRYDGVTFSPEGDHVYYVTYAPTGGVGTLYRIAALGGVAEKIVEDVDSRIAFSPDRTQFTFVRGNPMQATAWVMVAKADGSDVRQLARLEAPDQFTLSGPAWSADGKTIVAPARSLRDGPHGLIVAIDVATGATSRLEERWNSVFDLEWVPGTSSFLASAIESGFATQQLWQIRHPTGERRRITNDLNSYSSPSLPATTSPLATVQAEVVAHLWVSSADNPSAGVQITRGRGGTDGQLGLDWTPDGQIVFISTTSGRPQIWITGPDGRDARQLTGQNAEPVFNLSVSPDGQHVVFQRLTGRQMRVWRMALDGSEQKSITDGNMDQAPLAAPGGVVFFHRLIDGSARTFKVSIDGGGAVQVSDHPFRPIDVSPDGAQLLGVVWHAEQRRSALAIMPASGGTPRVLSKIPSFIGSWSPKGNSLIYPALDTGIFELYRYDLGSDEAVAIGSVPDTAFNGSISNDGKRLVMSRGGVASDVLLLTMRASGG